MPEFRNAMYYSGREEVFIQPILTEDGTVGGDKFAVRASSYYNGDYYAHHSFQYFEGTNCAISKNSAPTTSDPYYYTMYFPKGAKLYSITHRNRSQYMGMAKDLELQGSNDDSHWTTLTTYQNINDTANEMWTVYIPSAKQGWYRYYRYKITSTNGKTYAAIGFLTINGIWRNPETIEIPLYTRTCDPELLTENNEELVDRYYDSHGTYTLTLSSDKYLDVEIAGAGGGGSGAAQKAGDKSAGGGSGGRGALINSIIYVPAGTYQIVVGEGGAGSPGVYGNGSDCDSKPGSKGGTSSFFGIEAQGGDGGTKAHSVSYGAYGGSPGTSYGLGGIGGAGGASYNYTNEAANGKKGQDGWVIIKNLTNNTAPVVHSRRNVYGAYSNKNNSFASSINCKVPKKSYSTKYYKETAWTQPTLTANGTLGGSSFAVSASTQASTSYMPWMAFDGTDTKYWKAGAGSGHLIFYNPNPLKVTKISYKNWTVYPILVAVYGSHNNNVWIPIKIVRNTNYTSKAFWDIDLSSNTEFYNYYKVEVRCMTSDKAHCTELAITATQLITGTVSDYTKAVVEYDRLLLRQLTAGSYRFTSTGNITFTVPKGVKVIYVQAGSYNSSRSQSQSVVNTETGNTWCSAVMWDNGGSETVDWVTSTVNNYIKVNSGETYSLKVSSSSMASLPLISWDYNINNQPPVYDERKIKE